MIPRLRIPAILGLVLAAAACGTGGAPPTPETMAQYDYRLKHPIEVEPRVAALRLDARPAGGLTTEDANRLKSLAAAYIRRASGPLRISVGAVNPQDPSARAWAQAIAQQLLADGLKPAELRLELILQEPAIGPGTALLRYATMVAEVPDCYDWSDGPRNAPSANFGCSVQHNLGQMVANPRDLGEPEVPDDHMSARSDAVIDKMNQGGATWSVPLPLQAQPQGGGS